MSRVLVLNASFEPINVCTVNRAVVLLLKERAEMIERSERVLHSERAAISRPTVIRLVHYVRVPYSSRRRVSRRAVFARDGWACQYCGNQKALTIDHVIPRSKGGPNAWENVVACCTACNKRKGDSLLHEAGMKLTRPPRPPSRTVFIHVAGPQVPPSWSRYV